MTSQQPNRASHAIHSRHVGSFFALSGIGKSHKICSHSLLLNLHKAKLHRSNSVINIYSLTASLTCSNKISKTLKHILLFFPGFSYTAPRKKYPTWRRAYRVVKTLYRGLHDAVRTYTRTILSCPVVSFLYCAVLRKTTKHPFIFEFLHDKN